MYDWQDRANYATTDNTGAPDHIGIVTQVGGGTFVVTEGNMNGGKVGKRTVKVNGRYIRGFITPDFDMIARKLGGTSGGTADKPTKPTTQAAGTYTVKSGDTPFPYSPQSTAPPWPNWWRSTALKTRT